METQTTSPTSQNSFAPLKANYTRILPIVFRSNIKGFALWALKWLSLAALAFSLVLGFLIASNKNRCDRLLRFFGGDITLESERRNHDSVP
ncbi:MAG: hypothetical protein IKF72_01460 [Kiritimatiellae bacterium]|nr:hypothetical protein [Kiritimatiellia bacterium]